MADGEKSKSIWDMKIVRRALWDSLVKLDPREHDEESGDVRGRSWQCGYDEFC